ncbi:hypothetical protein AMI01nite_26010 [Aneurinibacillus migulanus]|nr:hypothetical protein AMI01nite_26010 [Aneurinibacillus migulanus]
MLEIYRGKEIFPWGPPCIDAISIITITYCPTKKIRRQTEVRIKEGVMPPDGEHV